MCRRSLSEMTVKSIKTYNLNSFSINEKRILKMRSPSPHKLLYEIHKNKFIESGK